MNKLLLSLIASLVGTLSFAGSISQPGDPGSLVLTGAQTLAQAVGAGSNSTSDIMLDVVGGSQGDPATNSYSLNFGYADGQQGLLASLRASSNGFLVFQGNNSNGWQKILTDRASLSTNISSTTAAELFITNGLVKGVGVLANVTLTTQLLATNDALVSLIGRKQATNAALDALVASDGGALTNVNAVTINSVKFDVVDGTNLLAIVGTSTNQVFMNPYTP